MKHKNYYASQSAKFTKKESEVFVNKSMLVILTFPMKYVKCRALNSLQKKYNTLGISIVFSKNATKNTFFHCFFRPEDFLLDTYKTTIGIHQHSIKLMFADIELIKHKFNKRK